MVSASLQKSPTLSPLEDADWVAAKVMVLRNNLGTILDRLKGTLLCR